MRMGKYKPIDFISKKAEDIPEDEFYLDLDLTDTQKTILDKILNKDESLKVSESIPKVLNVFAKLRGKEIEEITLREPQVPPVMMSLVNPRFFIGDKPGLGKTVMSAGSYALYGITEMKKKRKPKKVIVVTVTTHILGFQKEWESFGIDLLPLTNGTDSMRRTLRNANLDDYDGVIVNWDGLKINGFLEHYLQHHEDYGFIVFDETSKLLNPDTDLYKSVNLITNSYQGGIERAIFLNGSSFEKDLFDFYHQFNILKPKLIPSKKFLEDRYIKRGGKSQFVHDYVQYGGVQTIELVKRSLGEIEGYRNQDELRKRLKYYYIARSKSDYSDDLPEHNYVLHPIELTHKQREVLAEHFLISKVNSPETSSEELDENGNPVPSNSTGLKLTRQSSPKLNQLIEFADEVSEDRPIIYVFNTKAQETIKKELEKLGYKVAILSGKVTSTKKRNEIVEGFNNYEYDMLIFNIINAINLPTSNRILFYDIPTMPQTTNQIVGRIDRNNYEDKKFYDFFCYLDSPEMINLIKLSCFREYHSSKFTGQYVNIYGMLVAQLTKYIGNARMNEMQHIIDNMYETNKSFEEVTSLLENSLGI